MKNKTLAPVLIALVLLMCKNEVKLNLVEAQAAYDRLIIGMSKDDACWNFSVTCKEGPDINYTRDFGQSFSKKEYTVSMHIRNYELVRVELYKPFYEDRTRKTGAGSDTVIAEKGISREELNASYE
jgi:hypothetical protein